MRILPLAWMLAAAIAAAGCAADVTQEATVGAPMVASDGVATGTGDPTLPPLGMLGLAQESTVVGPVELDQGVPHEQRYALGAADNLVAVLAFNNAGSEAASVVARMTTTDPAGGTQQLETAFPLTVPAGGGGVIRLVVSAPGLAGDDGRLEPYLEVDTDAPIRLSGTIFAGVPGIS